MKNLTFIEKNCGISIILCLSCACNMRKSKIKYSHVRPSNRERLGSCPWALWVRMLHSERRSLRQEAISAWSLWVRRAPAGCRAEEAWLLLLCSGSLICSCRVRFCSISSWFWADSCNTAVSSKVNWEAVQLEERSTSSATLSRLGLTHLLHGCVKLQHVLLFGQHLFSESVRATLFLRNLLLQSLRTNKLMTHRS